MEHAAAEPPTAGEWLKRLLLQMVDRAVFDVGDLEANAQLALHRLRLRMKKADALLRLSKGAVRKTNRWRLRKQMRNVKNLCGNQRDAVVMAELASELGKKHGLHLPRAALPKIRPNARKFRELLSELRRELAEEVFDGLTWDDVRDNYARCYRSGRRRMRAAEQTCDAADFHRWRKREKALYYQSQALASVLTHPRHRLSQTRKLGKMLGRDHDLTLLQQETDGTSPENPWQEAIEARRDKLRAQVLRLGGKVYAPPSHRFARMRGLPD